MKKLYLIRDKRLYLNKVSKNTPEPLKAQIALDPPVSAFDFSLTEQNYLMRQLENHYSMHESRAGELQIHTHSPEQALRRVQLFLPWFRRFHKTWETGSAIHTLGLRAELREEN